MKLGIISGVHEDVLHLSRALDEMKDAGCDEIICLGDIVGWSPKYYGYPDTRDANAAVKLIRENCKYSVIGNHDLFAIQKLPQDRFLFSYPSNWYQLGLEERKALADGKVWLYDDDLPVSLTEENKVYLDSLPEFLVFPAQGHGILFSHYVYPNITGCAVEFDPSNNDSIKKHLSFMEEHGCDMGIFAHDLQGGVRIFSEGTVREFAFGFHALNSFPSAFNGPWVANGTKPNGYMILDTKSLEVGVIPLGAVPVKEQE